MKDKAAARLERQICRDVSGSKTRRGENAAGASGSGLLCSVEMP